MSIAANDLFSEAVEAIYDAAAEPANWPIALQAIADVFGDVGGNLIWRRDDGSFGAIVSPTLAPLADEWHRWQHADIRALRGAERAKLARLDVVTDRHLVTDQEMEEHPFYTQFLIPRGLGWLASAVTSPDPLFEVWLSVQRAKAKGPFSDEELGLLARIARHAEQSLRLSVRLFDAELSKLGLGEALARIGIGVFALDSLARVVFSNPAGERLLGKGLKIVNQRLRASAPREQQALDAAIASGIHAVLGEGAVAPRPVLIHGEGAERPLTLYALPVTPHGESYAASYGAAAFLTQTRAIVLAIDPQKDTPADPTLVRDLLGLTLGEARVASLVGFGLTPRAAAQRLGIGEETARVVLKRVFSKAGVSRQSELASLLARLVLR